MKKKRGKVYWLVMCEDAYLVSLPRALAGAGMNGGFTLDRQKAKRFMWKQTAVAAAKQVYHGKVKRVPPKQGDPE